MTRPTRVAVIGGGWAGMAAASSLAAAGLEVDVYEAGKVLGGRARRVDLDGVPLDNGLHLLLGAYTESLACFARVGSAPGGFLRTPLRLESVGGFRLACPPLPAPWHLLVGLLGARGIGWGDRMAAIDFMTRAQRANYRCERGLPVTALLDLHRQPARLRDVLWHPLCVAALNTPPDIADAQVFLNVLRDGLAGQRAASDLVFPATDLSALFPEPAARFVTERGGIVRTAEPVMGLAVDAGVFMLSTARRTARYAQVVCAIDPGRAAALLRELPGLAEAANTVAALRHAPIVSVYLQYGTDVALPGPMVGLDEGPADWVFDRERLCGQRRWVGAVISASDRWTGTPHDALRAHVEAQLARRLGLPGRATRTHVIAEKRATFLCTPELARPGHRTPLRGFHLAGDFTASEYPATLEGAVRSGLACARAVLEIT